MATKFEYRVCYAQQDRVTFVNGSWQGKEPPGEKEALESCPDVTAYLQAAGAEGWELVTVVGRFRSRGEEEPLVDRLFFRAADDEKGWRTWDTIYLKRAKP